MKRVIETLTNHLGIPGDASEDVILEKLQGLPAATVVAELQNSLKRAKDECDALRTELKSAEDEIVNRHLAEFEGVISEATKVFWTEQLMANRAGALAALNDLVEVAQRAKGTERGAEGKEPRAESTTRKPLHNRATARPVIPGVNGPTESPPTGSGLAAARIRNRAHEIVAAEKIPFIVAFRRAEKEST